MKINQLFTRIVERELAERLVSCIGLEGINDGRNFTKYDLIRVKAVENFKENFLDEISTYYLPCKARLYLVNMNEKKLLTVIKQVLRLHDFCVIARERNHGSKKIIVYRITHAKGPSVLTMHQTHSNMMVGFD
jgi:hypothetical protein